MSKGRTHAAVEVRKLMASLFALLMMMAPCAGETSRAVDAAHANSDASSAETDERAREPGSRFILTAHDGRTVTDADFRGRHMLVFFGYTHCPDVCPTSLLTVARVLELLGQDAALVQPVFITVDPARDTRAVLAEFVPHFDKRIIGLTGPQEMIDRVAKGYRVKYAKIPGAGTDGFYTVDHTATLFHIGPDGGYLGRFPYETSAEQIAERLRAGFAR